MTEINASAITEYLPDKYKPLSITAYKTVDSTNRAAKDMAAAGTSMPFLVVADSQSAGRGRLGRSFYSPASTGIYMSLTMGGFDAPQKALFITSAAAVAVTDAIISLTGESPGIKWVNDIYLHDRKICGILTEAQRLESEFAIIVGIGVNMTTTDFPEDISDVAESLKTDISREQMIAEITKNLLEICKSPENNNFIERYKKRSILLGKEINYFAGGEKKSAMATDVDRNGGLVILDEQGNLIKLSSGEVTVRLK